MKMKLKEIALRILSYLRALEIALDYDPMAEVGLRVRELETEALLRRNELAALTVEVRALRNGSNSWNGTV